MIDAQAQTVGIRAGINRSRFLGPVENGERYGLASGIHFGISYGYKFTSKSMLRFELLYTQKGTRQYYKGDSYFLIYTPKKTIFEYGLDSTVLNISNAYLSIPIVFSYQLSKKWEVYGGLSPSLLISPSGRGTRDFTSKDHPSEILFRQSLVYDYNSDDPKSGSSGTRDIRVIVDGEIVTIKKIAHAYYQTDFAPESFINSLDLSTVLGVNYFFNKGFFAGLRMEYGLLDVTSNKVDYSKIDLNPDKTLIRRADFDRNLDFSLSLGFRF
jgi:hypothetical protein